MPRAMPREAVPKVRQRPSPNHDDRRGLAVSVLVLHYTGMRTAEAALARLCDPAAKVSAHYCIDEDGTIWQLVEEAARAWHAGVSCWLGESDINARSIGIELVNPGHEFGYRPFPAAQMQALTGLCRTILARHSIPPRNVVGHSDIAPTRKTDPGELFDWRMLASQGIGLMPPADMAAPDMPALMPGARGAAVRALQQALQVCGYGCPQHGRFDEETGAVVTAFQRHYAPHRIDGVVDARTRAALDWLSGQAAASA